jgi:PAS domain S-box-containing protein
MSDSTDTPEQPRDEQPAPPNADASRSGTASVTNTEALVFRTLIDLMPDRIYAKDTESRFILANKAVAYYMGKSSPEEMIGKTDFDFYDEQTAAGYFAVEQELIHSGKPMIACEQLVPDLSTGQPGWLQTTKVHLHDNDGRLIGIVGIGRNITERKRIEGELQSRNEELTRLNAQLSEAQAQLVQSEKLAAIGQLAAGVAHEINNPIGYIFSNFSALERYVDTVFGMLAMYREAQQHIVAPDVLARLESARAEADLDYLVEDSRNLIAETKEGISRVRRIVQDLKDFSRVDASSEWAWSDLHRGIDSTLNILASEIKYKADVVKDYGDIPEVECLSSQINQVIMNLLMNAVHAIDAERGQITVRTRRVGEHVQIEVGDTGSGIPADVLPRIFDPFFTTKPIGKGTGLGLSLSYGIIQRHHGKIEVSSEPGTGTMFTVTLPIRHVVD